MKAATLMYLISLNAMLRLMLAKKRRGVPMCINICTTMTTTTTERLNTDAIIVGYIIKIENIHFNLGSRNIYCETYLRAIN